MNSENPGLQLQHSGAVVEQLRARLRELTEGGKGIDEYQVPCRVLAQNWTRQSAALRFLEYAQAFPVVEFAARAAHAFIVDSAREIVHRSAALSAELGVEFPSDPMEAVATREYIEIGRQLLTRSAANDRPITIGDDSHERDLRDSTRRFAQSVVAPEAERIHREDLLVPEHFIAQMSDMGYFGMSVPEEYGGVGMSNLMMVVATEELSAASLPAAGSLITRPEILTKGLLAGGTERQKRAWLPRIASGEIMVAVSVTEPNIGSDVASINCRADDAEVGGKRGFVINGAKAWCTFAGRADILALLARTERDAALGHKGLSLFIVEKDRFTGHTFGMTQSTGGRMTGKADATLGYRGMHSFTLQFQDFFVSAQNLVGEEDGRGKGFYLQMGGFAAGRLQTGGRAVGLAQAALEAVARYAKERPQFGKPIAEYQSTQYELGAMAAELEAARQLTYAAARSADASAPDAELQAAMAKLFSCRIAVNVTQRGQVLHGGWGYAEEYAISRYVADALVLPIFEGVEPILEMKVIARALLR
ncbi:MAG: acyl-CoA dehydrogenase family protein [Candidatus Hydrogenedentota bacterium]